MKKIRIYLFTALILAGAGACLQEKNSWEATGVDDIDRIRLEIESIDTDPDNALERRATLYRWWRFLWRQGYNMRAFDSIANELVNYTDNSPEAIRAIHQGYAKLEEMYTAKELFQEIRGEAGGETSRTDWPVYHGTDGSQRGYSPDAGPSEGLLAWKFPKGSSWNAKPVIENGNIYMSSPGIDVYGYCLDENTGEVIWKGRQFGVQYYNYYGSKHDPIITEDRVMFRTGHRETRMFIHDKSGGQLIEDPEPNVNAGTAAKHNAYIENGQTLVLADAGSGRIIWEFTDGTHLSGKPLLDGDRLILTSNHGNVYSFNTGNNKPVWNKNLGIKLGGSPTSGKDKVYITGKEETLFALDPENGDIKWTYNHEKREPQAYCFFSTPLENSGKVYIGTSSAELLCLDSETGKPLWIQEMSDWIRSAPLVMGDMVYVAGLDGKLTALKAIGSSVEVQWSVDLSPHGFTADLVGNSESILAGGRDLILYSVDPGTGNLRWKRGIVDGAFVNDEFFAAGWSGGLQPSPVVVDGIAYIGGSDGFVNALDAETGREIWRFETMASVSLAPTIADGRVFFSHLGGTSEHYTLDVEPAYYALDKNTGELIWESNDYGAVWVGSAYADNTLCFGNCDGVVFGVDAGNGEKLWEYNTALNTPHEGRPLDGTFIHGFPPGVYCNPVSDNTNFYTGSWSGYYYAFDQKSGKMIWRTQTNNGNLHGGLPDSSAPVLWKNHLYVQKIGHYLSAINIETGLIEWEWTGRAGYLQNGTIAANNGKVYGSITRRVTSLPYDCTVLAFNDVENGGEKLWEYRGGAGLTTPVITDDKLIFGSSADVFVTCLDPENGEVKWKFYTGGEMMENGPALYGDKVYVQTKNGWLFAIK